MLQSRVFSGLLCLFTTNLLLAQMRVSNLPPLSGGIESAIQQYFASAGLAILDVAFEGDPVALSRFQAGTDAIGLKSGIVLTSGHAQSSVANRYGPASFGLNQASTNNASTATSARLNALAYPQVVNDVAKIVITFIPYGDTIRFRYVFASEEYPEYGCSEYNDLFGFFLYRTGFPDTANIALIPGTNLPVTIENLHPMDPIPETPNCMPLFEQYYRNNDKTSNQPVYDGFTTVFVAKAAVIPCVAYTIELSIGDVQDAIYDSAVFLEEGSFSSNALHVSKRTTGEGGNIGEGCTAGSITLQLSQASSQAQVIPYSLVGTATNGLDYTALNGLAVIPAGETVAEIAIEPLSDTQTESVETLGVAIPISICRTDTVWFSIRDNVLQPVELPGTEEGCLTLDGTVANPVSSASEVKFQNLTDVNILPVGTFIQSTIQVAGLQIANFDSSILKSICLNIQHPRLQDLDIWLTAPNGNTLNLSTGNGGINSHYTNTCFSPGATNAVDASPVLAPFTGKWRPEGSWQDLFNNLSSLNGTWTLLIMDNAQGSSGVLLDWSLTFNPGYTVDYRWSPTIGLSCIDCPAPYANPSQTTLYQLSISDTYGCVFTDSVQVLRNGTYPNCPPCNFAGTFEFGPFKGQSNDISLDTIYLCRGDSLYIDHKGNASFSGDPLPNTPSGVGWLFSKCPPMANGTISALAMDTCNYINAVNGLPLIAFGTQAQGDIWFFNGGYIQNTFNSGKPAKVYFSPVTIDNFTDKTYEQLTGGTTGACVHVNTDETFAAVYLNAVVIKDPVLAGQLGHFEITGGLPELEANARYTNITIALDGNPSVKGTVLTPPDQWKPNTVIEFITPVEGTYNITVEDGKSCEGHRSVKDGYVACSNADRSAPDCVAACVSCDFEQVQGSTNTFTSFQNPFCGALHRTKWFGFVAGATTATFNATPSNCQNNDGLQLALYTDCLQSPIACNQGGTGMGNIPIQLINVPLTVGQTYYLVVDTWIGDSCDFEIRVTPPAAAHAPELQSPNFLNPTTNMCQNTAAIFSITSINTATKYTWNAPPGSLINGQVPPLTLNAAMGRSVNIQFGAQSGTVTVQAANACRTSPIRSIDVEVQSPPNVSAVGGTLNCTPQTLTLSGNSTTPGVTYTWSGPNNFTSNLQNPTVSAVGTYTLTVRTSAGCSASANAVVTSAQTLPTATAQGGALTCVAQSIALQASSSTPGATYTWTGPSAFTSSQQNPVVATPGNYTLTVRGTNGCTATATAAVTQDIAPPNAAAQGGALTCAAPSIALQASSSTPSATYTWTGPGAFTSSQQNPVVATPGNYTLTVRGINGCTATATATVLPINLPMPVINSPGSICSGMNTLLNASAGYTQYVWSSGQSTQNISVNTAGVYALTVTDTNGCTGTATTNLLVNPGPMAEPFVDIPVCSNTGNIILTVAGGQAPYRYLWSNNATTQNLSNLPTGNYLVTISDTKGCTANLSINVEAKGRPIASLAATAVKCGQAQGAVNLNFSGGTGPWSYRWSNGSTSEDLVQVPAGNYTVTVTDAKGCTATATATVESQGGIRVETTAIICKGDFFTVGTTKLATAGTYEITLPTTAGCDSTVILALEVVNPADFEAHNDSAFMPLEEIAWDFNVIDNDRHPVDWVLEITVQPRLGTASPSNRSTIRYTLKSSELAGTDSLHYTICPPEDACPAACQTAALYIQVQTGSLDIAKKQIPNAITPNDDGLNDWFDPLYVLALNGINVPPERARLHLINRWGEVIYEAQPYEPWTGLRGAKGYLLPQGVYYYRLELDLGKKVVLTGAVTLFR